MPALRAGVSLASAIRSCSVISLFCPFSTHSNHTGTLGPLRLTMVAISVVQFDFVMKL